MKFFLNILFVVTVCINLTGCQTVSTKIDEATQKEEKKLSEWIGKKESELKKFFGQPDRIDFNNTRNRHYVYITQKLKIKCERKFEINEDSRILGYSSKNCF
jgi:hypothetical protein|tara:strand:+ start:171 stop:476 length:306 start_codon:yes stop_codon:yes gene_type:complete